VLLGAKKTGSDEMSVRDPVTGEFKPDLKLIHVKVITGFDVDQPELESVAKFLSDALKARGLEKEYIVVCSSSGLDIELGAMESLIQKLGNESEALKTANIIDQMIAELKKIREKRWREQEAESTPAEVRAPSPF